MKRKPNQDEFRMKASDFDETMRRAFQSMPKAAVDKTEDKMKRKKNRTKK